MTKRKKQKKAKTTRKKPVKIKKITKPIQKKVKELSRQEMFCREFLVDYNSTQAGIRAGYSPKSAHSQASRLLSKESVRARIKELQEPRMERLNLTADFVLNGLIESATRCMQHKPVMEWDPRAQVYKQKVDPETSLGIYEFDSRGANEAFKTLGMNLDLWKSAPAVVVNDFKAIQIVTEKRKQIKNKQK